MNDQPTKAMTLREAVEIAMSGFPYGWGEQSENNYRHARAIVDAAVEAHEALLATVESGAKRGDDGPERSTQVAFCAAHDRLRALERGEDTRP